MTVKQLMDQLVKMPLDAEILIVDETKNNIFKHVDGWEPLPEVMELRAYAAEVHLPLHDMLDEFTNTNEHVVISFAS